MASGRLLVPGGDVDAGRGEGGQGLGRRLGRQGRPEGGASAGGVEGVAGVDPELGVLVPHDGVVGHRPEAGLGQRGGQGLGPVVGPGGVAADVEHAVDPEARAFDDAGVEVDGGSITHMP